MYIDSRELVRVMQEYGRIAALWIQVNVPDQFNRQMADIVVQ